MPRFAKRAIFITASLLCFIFVTTAPGDWPQWGGSSTRNNAANVTGLPSIWEPGEFNRKTDKWNKAKSENIKWVAKLGHSVYGTPVVADGRIFVGSSNSAGYLKRYPSEIDLGCLLCFRESDGQFLWQFSAEKLPAGRVHDWPMQGIASSPLVEGDRAWFVSNRCEVVCVDTQGFYDNEDDGPVVGEEIVLASFYDGPDSPRTLKQFGEILDQGKWPDELRIALAEVGEPVTEQIPVTVDQPEKLWSCKAGQDVTKTLTIHREDKRLLVTRKTSPADKYEADVVWRFDMMARLGVSPTNRSTCSITNWKDTLFVCTGNGVGVDLNTIPAPDAPSFIAMDKRTGEVLWTSNLPAHNIHNGQWSSPAVGIMGGVPQVVFGGGDGWIYSFHAEQWENRQPRLLWKFDTNPKDSVLVNIGRGNRNEVVAIPVLYDNNVFVATGQDPDFGDGYGCVWCIDATKKLDGSDVSPQLVLDARERPVSPRRVKQIQDWKQRELLDEHLDLDLDRGVASEQLRDNIGLGTKRKPGEMKVKTLIKGLTWELTFNSADHQETMYIGKQIHINAVGDMQCKYSLTQPTGERVIDNPNSAVVWKFDKFDRNGDGKITFEKTMHRSVSSVVIQGELAFCADFSGLIHCIDRRTGKPYWSYDMFASCWATPLFADGKLFVPDSDGDIAVFHASADPAKAGNMSETTKEGKPILNAAFEVNMLSSIYCNPVAAKGVLYIATQDRLFAIEQERKP